MIDDMVLGKHRAVAIMGEGPEGLQGEATIAVANERTLPPFPAEAGQLDIVVGFTCILVSLHGECHAGQKDKQEPDHASEGRRNPF